MAASSAGILPYRFRDGRPQVLLVHPGGPYWAKKDDGAWSIPKGEYDDEEDPFVAATRELAEELGERLQGDTRALTPLRQKGGKLVTAWAMHTDFDTTLLHSNEFEMEWPPKSGKRRRFPEVDRAEWMELEEARRKILESQRPLLDELEQMLGGDPT